MNDLADAGQGRHFDDVFPRPIGFEAFKAEFEANRAQQNRQFNVEVK